MKTCCLFNSFLDSQNALWIWRTILFDKYIVRLQGLQYNELKCTLYQTYLDCLYAWWTLQIENSPRSWVGRYLRAHLVLCILHSKNKAVLLLLPHISVRFHLIEWSLLIHVMWIHLFCADRQASPTEYKLHQSFGGIKGG